MIFLGRLLIVVGFALGRSLDFGGVMGLAGGVWLGIGIGIGIGSWRSARHVRRWWVGVGDVGVGCGGGFGAGKCACGAGRRSRVS